MEETASGPLKKVEGRGDALIVLEVVEVDIGVLQPS